MYAVRKDNNSYYIYNSNNMTEFLNNSTTESPTTNLQNSISSLKTSLEQYFGAVTKKIADLKKAQTDAESKLNTNTETKTAADAQIKELTRNKEELENKNTSRVLTQVSKMNMLCSSRRKADVATQELTKSEASIVGQTTKRQVVKGTRWMPWHREARKDAATGETPRGAGSML